jgi:hypothetical protein
MDNKKGNAGKKRSPDSDEGIGSSVDSDSSSSGTKDNKERADCDSSPETPELNTNVKVIDVGSGDWEYLSEKSVNSPFH